MARTPADAVKAKVARADASPPVMTNHDRTVGAVKSALRLCKGLGANSPSSMLGPVGERITRMFMLLDGLISQLPDPTPEDVMADVEKVVEAIHDVDQAWPGCGDGPAEQKLDVAGQRLVRLARRLGAD
jgi:hypothetical protein